ncbi:uncharacterized protein Z519_10883 [Cladophialophora bantiana CBS 173.52]|uniref:Uncharacterized protein n=1 Tax=Cladophialophora bantiana (strain ATCC 10958 / CBS 173.52 / CDC B-1940 / NIH 8579) TaxID=1442370 RepID=A0A0D2EDU7_CLAB1|nr:uncharacterized protein Z519_10883 [Cladophialophora bantiana CBS 173.52]KIW88316.1 hypothetical protein Z519_10883 [Cladophialophora bantiana CBS 173.52]
MDKFKTIMDKGDTQEKSGPTGRLTGQGSHFPQREDQPAGDATASQENTTAGYVLGAFILARTTSLHRAYRPTNSATDTDARQPKSGPDSGTAAIGETSTYSSHALPKGDTVGNVVDSRSEDPTTYRVPEHSYLSSKGVPEGGPLAAAAHAFHKDKDYSTSHIPGAFPKDVTAHDATTINPSTLTTTTSPAERLAVYGQVERTKVPDAATAAQFATRGTPGSPESSSEEPKRSGTIGKILGAVGLGTAASGAAAAASRAEGDQPHAVVDTPDQPTTTTGLESYTAPSRSGLPPSHQRKESIPTTAYPAGVDSPAPINPPVGGTSVDAERNQRDHVGRNAGLAAAGLGAGTAAAGVYVMQDSERETASPDRPLRDDAPARTPGAAAGPPSEGATKPTPASQPVHQDPAAHNAALAGGGASVVPEYSQRQDRLEAQAQKDKAKQEAARAGAANVEGGATIAPEYTVRQDKVSAETERQRHKKEEETALAGIAGAGAGAAGLYEYNQRQDRLEEDAQRQKDLAEQETARQKQFEKDQKAAEKHAKKEEKHHQKELKKEEKLHQKELEKEEKAREKAAEKEEQHHRKELEREQKEREKAAAAAAVGAGATGAGAYEVHDKDKHPPPATATDESGHTKLHKEPEEKRPGLLKRIFRRRKNKDTGEEEEYEDHEHHEAEAEHDNHHVAEAGVAGSTGVAVAGTAAAASHEPARISYEAQSGGLQKPSYNPFSKDDPARGPATTASRSTPAATNLAPEPPRSRRSSVGPDAIDPATTHLPYDPIHNPESRKSISEQGEHLDRIGGLTAHHPYAEGEQKPGLAHRIIDALKPLPDKEELQHHAEEYHHHGPPSQIGR